MTHTARSLAPTLLAAALCGATLAEDPPAFTPGPADSKAVADVHLFAFAKYFERAVNSRDTESINASFDQELLLDRVCDGLPVTEAQRRTFARKVGIENAAPPYLRAVGQSGHIKMLRVRDVDGTKRALYRLVGEDGLNYHDALIATGGDGRPAIVDAHVFATGELMSTALRRMLVQDLDLDHPAPPRADDDVAEALVSLNGLIVQEQWEGGLDAVLRIEEAVGDDAYLDTLRAFFLCERGTYDRAAEAAERSVTRDAMLEEARLMRLRIALAQQDYDTVAECLTVLERDFGWALENIGLAPAYQHFIRSPSYKRWMTERIRAMAE